MWVGARAVVVGHAHTLNQLRTTQAGFKRENDASIFLALLNRSELAMTPSQAETIAATDNATVAIMNVLIAFLEKQGVLKREEFGTFLQAAIEGWRVEGTDDKLIRLIEIKAKAMALGPPPSLNN